MQNETYDPLSIESKWQEKWEQGKKFQPIESDKKFSIVIPPPNVTGSLHMGHALEHSIIDVITRVKRMNGFQTLWLPGTDHAGIITQLLVEKDLEESGVKTSSIKTNSPSSIANSNLVSIRSTPIVLKKDAP